MVVTSYVLGHAGTIRVSSFLIILSIMAIWEVAAPRRRQMTARQLRWPSNLGIVILDSLTVRVLIPVSLAEFAGFCESRGWGLLTLLEAPGWIAVPLAILAIDLAIYWQHVIFHAVPALWRVHRMHHADVEFDVTTGIRFHPIEIVLSVLIKMAVILLLGAAPIAVLAFEVLLNATSMFNHGNVRIPDAVDKVLRLVVVTPDMHRVHHSNIRREIDSNFGFNLSVWDRLFRTYRPQPLEGQLGMKIGLDQFRAAGELRLDKMLTQPFREGAQAGPMADAMD
jgi:sterol desaturase/sphingolipid hydroxylase (fatty acid hydroxylase superfamily)